MEERDWLQLNSDIKKFGGVVCRQLGATETEDVLQEALMVAARAIHSLRNPAARFAFLSTIVRRCAIVHIQQAIQRRRYDTGDVLKFLPADGPNPEQLAIERELTARLGRILKVLPPREREILTRSLDGQSAAAIKKALHLNNGQLRNCKSRAKRCLMERLGVAA